MTLPVCKCMIYSSWNVVTKIYFSLFTHFILAIVYHCSTISNIYIFLTEQMCAAQILRSQVFLYLSLCSQKTAQQVQLTFITCPPVFQLLWCTVKQLSFTFQTVSMPFELTIHWMNERNSHLKACCFRLPASSGGHGCTAMMRSHFRSFLCKCNSLRLSLKSSGHGKQSITVVFI